MSRLALTDFCGTLGKTASTVPSHGDEKPQPSASRPTAILPASAPAAATSPRPAGAAFHDHRGTYLGDAETRRRGDAETCRGGTRESSGIASASSHGALTSSATPATEKTWVEGHPRKLPEPPTLAIVLEQFRIHENRPMALGRIVAEWLSTQPDRPADAQLTRSQALREIRMGLVAQQQLGLAGRLDRFLASYYVARELGWQAAWKLRYAAIRELLPLFGRNAASEVYELRPRVAAATRILWQRMIDDRLTAHQVREEVRRLMPRRTLAIDGAARHLAAVRREVARLKSREDLLAVIRLAEERLARLGLAGAPAAA